MPCPPALDQLVFMGRDPEHEVDAPHIARFPWAIEPPHGFAPFSPAPMRLAARRGTVVSSSLSENACPNITMTRTPPGKGNGRFVFPDQLQNLRPAPDTFSPRPGSISAAGPSPNRLPCRMMRPLCCFKSPGRQDSLGEGRSGTSALLSVFSPPRFTPCMRVSLRTVFIIHKRIVGLGRDLETAFYIHLNRPVELGISLRL